MKSISLCIASGAVCAALAQPPARPEFEVASIKPSAPQVEHTAQVGFHVDGAQLRVNYFPLRDYVRVAYRLKENQVAGPEWMNSAYFDIAAKIPESAPRDTILEMLQTLLEARFELKTHREIRNLPVYALLQGKSGFKVKPIEEEAGAEPARSVDVTAAGSAAGVSINFGRGASFSLANNKFDVKKLSVSEFCDALSRFADRQVVDMTGAPGRYDFTVEMTPEDYGAMLVRSAMRAGVSLPPEALKMIEGVSGESLFRSLESVGLKIESRKAPIEVTVVDHIARAPKEN